MFKFTVYFSDQAETITARTMQSILGKLRAFESRGYYCSTIEAA